ncbi:MAG: sigma-54 dependent transcriptional regulator [Proteobacteria bacterium]|nr:sigma-54 dependent transcriptional regulator [Pseudomonadota bacterium]
MSEQDNKKRLLVIDDEENMRHMLFSMVTQYGYQTETAADGLEGLEKVEQARSQGRPFDVILCDIKMPNMDGMSFLKAGKDLLTGSTVVVMSAYGTIDSAVEAMKLGAYDYISKPFKADEIKLVLEKASEREKLKNENLFLKKRIKTIESDYSFNDITAKSKAMKDVFYLAEKAARFTTTVLITGGSGTGKELIAKGIHLMSDRADKFLVPVNCGGIPENLMESEFFGYKKGAFTDAKADKKGLFEEAEGGTLFLDEIGELPLSMQVKLLRVLQENEIRAVGELKTRKINVRVIAATARNLEDEVQKGNFREDLFYRLNVLSIKLPPLKDRREDIPVLCERFMDMFNLRFGRHIKSISPAAMGLFYSHDWPGNIRELENAIERAIVLADEDVLLPEHFTGLSHVEPIPLKDTPQDGDMTNLQSFSLKTAKEALERTMIIRALRETNGNRTHASRLLEISHPSLLSKIKAYDIDL